MDRPTRIITVDWGARVVGALSLIISAGVAFYLYSEFNSTSDDTNLRKVVEGAIDEKLNDQDSLIAERVKTEFAKELAENEQSLIDLDSQTVRLMNSIKNKWDQLADGWDEMDKQDRLARDNQFANYLQELDTRIATAKLVVDAPNAKKDGDSEDKQNDLFAKDDTVNQADTDNDDVESKSTEVRLRPLRGFVNLLHIENKNEEPIVVDHVSFDPMEVVDIDRTPSTPAGVSRSKIKHLVFDDQKHNRATVAEEHAEYRMSLKPFVIAPQGEVYLRGEIRSDDYSGYGFSGRIVFSYLGQEVFSANDATLVFVKR